MLLKCTPDGRRIKVNGTPVQHGNIARGMKMTMSTTATMSARVHRKVMRAPHKRAHPGKMTSLGKMAAHSGKLVHPGKMIHPGKLSHLGRFGKLQHYAHTTHSLRPPEPCGDSNDSGLGPDHDQRHSFNRLSETGEEWSGMEPKRSRSETDVKLECDDAIDEFAFAPRQHTYAACPAPAPTDNHLVPPLIRASSSISSPGQMAESPGKRFQEHSFRSCGKLGNSGKLASKYPGGGKIMSASGKLANGGKLGGKLGGKYGGKLAQALARRRALAMQTGPSGLASPLTNRSRDGTVELQILCQPETQHRARYQTEGSRGAVKDNSGNGFPIVKLVGYDKPAILQVYIGTDTGRVAPHMFYQACRVSGKNSTPCKERKDDGTVIIEIELEPAKNWQVTCDCVGILKERNVDVEHRFGESLSGSNAGPAHMSRGKKKSTRCRMVFRTEIINHDGQAETLQVCSTQIICTQPPGVPEVCRKSLVSCPATGGLELYLLGKNFLKETRVVFSQRQDGRTVWEEEVIPDKEFLQQSHLVCCVPPYPGDIVDPVQVHVFVRSGGRASEPHSFYYTPPAHDSGPMHCTRHHTQGHDERMPWSAGRASSLAGDEPALKAELEDSVDREQDAPRADDVVDLRLKTEATFSAFPDGSSSSSSPPAVSSFTRQLQAIQTQVQTDKMVESVAAAIFNTEDGVARPLDADILLASLGETGGLERRLARQSAQMEALVEDAMKATAAMMPGDSDKLDELVNSRADAHLSAAAPSAQMSPESLAVTPPAAVKSMILTAAAEILSSDSTMDALVTSAINTANILTTEEAPLTQTASEPTSEAPLAAAVSAAVTQAMSQAVSQVVSAAVTQEMAAPVQRLTDMSDSDLLSYINPSTFDQV